MSAFWYLEQVDLYKILCPSKLKGYADKHYRRFNKGDCVYIESDSASKIYLISKGKVKIVHYTADGEELVRAILTHGEIFGEKAILGDDIRRERAITIENNTLICPLSVDKMYTLMRKDEKFSLTIHKIIGIRYKKLERRLEQLFFKDVKTRLLEFIIELIRDRGMEINGDHIEIENVYTQKDIADLIGTSRETVTKLLNQLKKSGLFDYSRQKMIVSKRNEIEQMLS